MTYPLDPLPGRKTGSELLREIKRRRKKMQGYRMAVAGILLFSCILIGLALKFADAVDRLAEPENCEIEHDDPLVFDHAVWRGVVAEKTTSEREAR